MHIQKRYELPAVRATPIRLDQFIEGPSWEFEIPALEHGPEPLPAQEGPLREEGAMERHLMDLFKGEPGVQTPEDLFRFWQEGPDHVSGVVRACIMILRGEVHFRILLNII